MIVKKYKYTEKDFEVYYEDSRKENDQLQDLETELGDVLERSKTSDVVDSRRKFGAESLGVVIFDNKYEHTVEKKLAEDAL